jgi:endonuclease G
MKKLLTLFTVLLTLTAFSQNTWKNGKWVNDPSNKNGQNITKIEIPKVSNPNQVIYHTAYSLLYNEQHEQASWVAYNLTASETHRRYERTNKFISDPKVRTGTASQSDYSGSGYDRGHMAPAAGHGVFQRTAMYEIILL